MSISCVIGFDDQQAYCSCWRLILAICPHMSSLLILSVQFFMWRNVCLSHISKILYPISLCITLFGIVFGSFALCLKGFVSILLIFFYCVCIRTMLLSKYSI